MYTCKHIYIYIYMGIILHGELSFGKEVRLRVIIRRLFYVLYIYPPYTLTAFCT